MGQTLLLSIFLIHVQISLMKVSQGLKAVFAVVIVLNKFKIFLNGVHSSRTSLFRDEPFPKNIWKLCYSFTKIISQPKRTQVTIVLHDLSGTAFSPSVGVCCSKQQKAMLLFQTHQSCNPQVQNLKAQRIHHITIHNSKIFSVAISMISPCSKVYNSAVKVHARLKFVL